MIATHWNMFFGHVSCLKIVYNKVSLEDLGWQSSAPECQSVVMGLAGTKTHGVSSG
jgi:hypothetical protein